MIIYINCGHKQFSTVKKKSSEKMLQFEKVDSFHPKNCSKPP